MDPDSNLTEQLEAARAAIAYADAADNMALDEWIVKGGGLPQRWKR